MNEKIKTKFIILWRIIVAIGMISVVISTTILCYMFYKHEIRDIQNNKWSEPSKYSTIYECEHTPNSIRLKDINTGKYLTPTLSSIYMDNLKDSITVFFQKGKRGFLNIYTGEIIIDAQFERAWVFSEGLSAVVKDGKLGFINNKNEVIIPFKFSYNTKWINQVDFLFKKGYCTVLEPTTGKHGLIDKTGKWIVEPQYDYINNPKHNFRIVQLNNKYGVMDSTLQISLPIEYEYIEYYKDGFLVQKKYEKQLIAYDCKTILQSFIYDNICYLTYETDGVDAQGYTIQAKSNMNSYNINGLYGLMDKKGKIITKPLYTAIEAISKDIFVCDLKYDGPKIMINEKGEVINGSK